MSDSEKKWLIRSSNTVLGPYSKQEVEDLLKETVLLGHDEVVGPCTFWRTLQNHPEFKESVERFRSKNPLTNLVTGISGKLTSSFIMNTTTTTKKQTFTQTLTTPVNAPKEKEVLTLPHKSPTEKIKEMEVEIQSSPSRTPHPSRPQGARKNQLEGAKKTKKATGVVWIVSMILVLGFIGYIIFQRVIRPQIIKKEKPLISDIRKAGHSAYTVGNYEEAFRHFEKGLKEGFLGTEEKLLMISLLIQKNKIEAAENLLQSIPDPERSDTRFLLVQGLLLMHENRFSDAEKLFKKAQGFHSESSLLNLGLVKFFEKDYTASLNYVNELILSGYQRGIGFYLKALNQIQLSSDPSNLKETITSYLDKTPEYHQEFYLLMAYLSALQGNKEETRSFIEKTLKEDPYFVEEYHYDPFFAVNLLDWSFLVNYCAQIFTVDSGNSFFNAINGFCLLKTNARDKGASLMERAKTQTPEQPVILSLYAFHLMQGGLFTEAEKVLRIAIQHNKLNTLIPHIMKARLYEKREEWASALQSWKKALSLNSYHITSLAGMAVSSFHLNRISDMEYYRDKGLDLYPYHKQLLMLQDSP